MDSNGRRGGSCKIQYMINEAEVGRRRAEQRRMCGRSRAWKEVEGDD